MILASVFAVLGIVLTILPFGTIALLPVVLALVLALITFRISASNNRLFPKIVLVVAAMNMFVVIGKDIFVKDTVVVDKQFEKEKIESKKEDIKDLEGL